jgi:hypothetical protein
MGFYHFGQNNSGGSFDFDKEAGVTHHVVVEGDTIEDVVKRARDIGIYFDGCDAGIDCNCCGDRWHEPYREELDADPLVYGEHPSKLNGMKWMADGFECAIHHKDGTIDWY